MKRFFTCLAFAAALATATCFAGYPISKVDKITPSDEIFMDMATSAAAKSKNSNGLPCGAVIILNNAFRSAGTPAANVTAEQNAIAKAALPNLANAVIYTVNEPTVEAYNDICRFGAQAVYFVNPRQTVIAKGIYTADDYDDSRIDTSLTPVPMHQISFEEAEDLLK